MTDAIQDNEALAALELIRDKNGATLGEGYRINKAEHDLLLSALLKSSQVDEDGLPCVSCGKPSQVATPDDADMCHQCFGQFNATEYDNLKAQVDGLVEALDDISKQKDHSIGRTKARKALTKFHNAEKK